MKNRLYKHGAFSVEYYVRCDRQCLEFRWRRAVLSFYNGPFAAGIDLFSPK